MVKFFLNVKAELEGVTDLEPSNEPQNPFEFTFKVECTKCREVHDKPVTINTYEQHEITGSRGEASFVFRCKSCKHEHSASIARSGKSYTAEDNGKKIPLLTIDARGLDFNEFIPQGVFKCVAVDGPTKFDEVDLEDNEWYDYDDNAGAEVSIVDVSWSIDRS